MGDQMLFLSFFLEKSHTGWMKDQKCILEHIFPYISGSTRTIVSENNRVYPWVDPHFHENLFKTTTCIVRFYT